MKVVLTLVMLFSIPVYAGDALGSGNQGGASTGSQDLSGRDGFLGSKSGYIVYTSDVSGNATSPIVAFTWDGQTPYITSGASLVTRLETRFGQEVTDTKWGMKSPWGYAPFSGSSGTGLAIKNWLLTQEIDGYKKGMDYVMARILGMSDAQIFDWYADPNNRLDVLGIIKEI